MSVYSPFHLQCKQNKFGWIVTKEYKARSETLGIFNTQREADDYARNFMKDTKETKKPCA